MRGEFSPTPDMEEALPETWLIGVEMVCGGMEAGDGGIMDSDDGLREDGRNDMISQSTRGMG